MWGILHKDISGQGKIRNNDGRIDAFQMAWMVTSLTSESNGRNSRSGIDVQENNSRHLHKFSWHNVWEPPDYDRFPNLQSASSHIIAQAKISYFIHKLVKWTKIGNIDSKFI